MTLSDARWRWVFAGLLALTALLRLPGIARPLVGNFATKNVVYAMIARNWAEGRTDFRYPMLDCLVGGQRSLHMLEFPVSAYATAWGWKTFGGSLEIWGRATSVAFCVLSVAILFSLVRRRHGPVAAAGAAAALALSPVSIIYGQSFMLEASLVCMTLGTVWFFDRWLAGGRVGWLVLTTVSLTLLLLTKIYMLVLFLPLAFMILLPLALGEGRGEGEAATESVLGRPGRWGAAVADSIGKATPAEGWPPTNLSQRERGQTSPPKGMVGRRMLAAVCLFAAIGPAAVWYWHAAWTAGPESPWVGRIFYSVRDSAEMHRPPHPLLRSPDFYRQLLDDLSGPVLTPLGLALALAGLLHPQWRQYLAWLLAMAVLVAALPLKFHAMNYYWLAVLPPLCILIGLGWQVVAQRLSPKPAAVAVLLAVAVVFSIRYAVRPAMVTPREDLPVVPAGLAIQQLTPPEEPVVTMHGSGIHLLYYCRRPGWAIPAGSPNVATAVEKCRRQGARYFVVTGADAARIEVTCGNVIQRMPAVRGPGYRIYRLRP